jgi:glycopeptide antibiotics resistance protein
MDTWQSGVILRGLETANFRLFKTVRMYIVYRDRLNSFENLFGNVAIFIPFGALLPWVDSRFAAWWKVLVNAFLFVAGFKIVVILCHLLFSSFGAFDVDDLLLNCFGAMLGYWGWLVFRKKA